MVDLINRAALLEFAHNHVNGTVDCNDIARFPAVDAEPVRHGHWIAPEDGDRVTACICSICDWHGHIMEDDVMGMNYCPNCGAKMSEVDLVDGNN